MSILFILILVASITLLSSLLFVGILYYRRAKRIEAYERSPIVLDIERSNEPRNYNSHNSCVYPPFENMNQNNEFSLIERSGKMLNSNIEKSDNGEVEVAEKWPIIAPNLSDLKRQLRKMMKNATIEQGDDHLQVHLHPSTSPRKNMSNSLIYYYRQLFHYFYPSLMKNINKKCKLTFYSIDSTQSIYEQEQRHCQDFLIISFMLYRLDYLSLYIRSTIQRLLKTSQLGDRKRRVSKHILRATNDAATNILIAICKSTYQKEMRILNDIKKQKKDFSVQPPISEDTSITIAQKRKNEYDILVKSTENEKHSIAVFQTRIRELLTKPNIESFCIDNVKLISENVNDMMQTEVTQRSRIDIDKTEYNNSITQSANQQTLRRVRRKRNLKRLRKIKYNRKEFNQF
ncbi:hypothetical protein SNEBB_001705 [Seison nebaliae]|nr:hypothetical protein SNEBB_001705 [Seison nebaliae]